VPVAPRTASRPVACCAALRAGPSSWRSLQLVDPNPSRSGRIVGRLNHRVNSLDNPS